MAEINTLAEPTQNAKVSFLSEQVVKLKENMLSRTPSLKSGVENAVTEIEKDETILVLFNKVWYNRLCGESALYTSSRPFNL